MSEMQLSNPSEIEKLLTKYKGGRVPPLVVKDKGNDEGLISSEFLEILQKGFLAIYSIPICISVISKNITGSSNVPPQEKDLILACKYVRSLQNGGTFSTDKYDVMSDTHRFCECFSINHATARHDGRIKGYMCRVGMISFAVPIFVAGEMVAVVSVECKKPEDGTIWPKEFAEQDLPAASTSSKVNLWQETKRRIRECEESLGLEQNTLMKEISDKAEMNPGMGISPENLGVIVSNLENASNHLSKLANTIYRSEKESIVSWIRAGIASALSSTDNFWEKIQECFGSLARLVGVDYILLISRDRSRGNSLQLQCQYGLPQDLPLQHDWSESSSHTDEFVNEIGFLEQIQEVDLKRHRDVPILGMLYSLYGKGISYPVLVASATAVDGVNYIMLGKKEPIIKSKALDFAKASDDIWLREDDSQHIMTVTRELAIIKNVFFSIKKLQETVEEQTNFMESLSHDLRTPIQNIIMAAENLKENRVPPERASRTIAGLITQLQRLDLLAQKAWMLEQIRLDKLMYNDKQPVNYYKIIEECRELMTDMAERESIEIHINPDIRYWRDIYVDPEILRLVVLNLLHNGIKYSFPNTCIRLGGWQDSLGIGAAMTFSNEGIHIHDEEKDRIFQRYFRSNDAIKMNPSGSGIGLALVKEFVDHYKGKIDVTSTEVGFGRYLNVFSIFLPGR